MSQGRRELSHTEGLAEVVVSPDRQTNHEVGLRATSRQHDHRHRTIPLDLTAHLQTIETREHQIENHHIRSCGSDQSDRARAVLRHSHRMAIAAKVCCYRCGKLRFVLHHHDLGHTPKLTDPMCRFRHRTCEDVVQAISLVRRGRLIQRHLPVSQAKLHGGSSSRPAAMARPPVVECACRG